MHDLDLNFREDEESNLFGSPFGAFEEEGEDGEADELALAAELLEITTDEELDQFLGDFIKKVGRGLNKAAKGLTGKSLGQLLKTAAKKVLPIAGKALGGLVGGPVGANLGGQLGSMGAGLIKGELDGMSEEDAQFEVARRFVRFANDTIYETLNAPPTANPQQAVTQAAVQAAQRHLPGLVRGQGGPAGSPATHTTRRSGGRWVRYGNRILLLGV